MPLIDIDLFDFTMPSVGSRKAVVKNETEKAVLHVAVKSPVPWVDIYPAEFALAPNAAQTVVVHLLPKLSRDALVPVKLRLWGQYLHVNATETGSVPPDVTIDLSVLPPVATCPTCGTNLPEEARECRRCGERIRLCPVCAAPNTWMARTCRVDAMHVIRAQSDWLTSPGGRPGHDLSPAAAAGAGLARRWSLPAFAPTSAADTYEWSAPVAAFGMMIVSAIDSTRARSVLQAYEIATGSSLWDIDLPDAKGVYPDRGSLAISPDGMVYAATLGGTVTAVDAIRGTLRWTKVFPGAAYGGLTAVDDALLAPLGDTLYVLDRHTGAEIRRHELTARLDTSPAADSTSFFTASEDGRVTAFDRSTGDTRWSLQLDGAFDAAPLVRDGTVYVATMAGTVHALDAETGSIHWQTKASLKPIAVTPAMSADGLIYVAGDDGSIHVIAAVSGKLVRSRRVSSSPLRTSPVCSGSTVFAGADDGNIYALDSDYVAHLAYETTSGARIGGAGIALYGDLIAFAATNGVVYVLQIT